MGMVNHRVNLTPAQKRQRGSLTSCVLGGDLGVCCSTAQSNGGSSGSNLPITNLQQQSQQQTVASEPVAAPVDYDSDAEVIIPTGSCPEMTELPPIEACQGKNSTCWSVGLPDVDCVDNALCCFDGCVNACFNSNIDMAGIMSGLRPTAPRPAPRPVRPATAPRPAPRPVRPAPRPAPRPATAPWSAPNPAPAQNPQQTSVQVPPNRQRPNNVVNQVLQPAPQAQGGGGGAP